MYSMLLTWTYCLCSGRQKCNVYSAVEIIQNAQLFQHLILFLLQNTWDWWRPTFSFFPRASVCGPLVWNRLFDTLAEFSLLPIQIWSFLRLQPDTGHLCAAFSLSSGGPGSTSKYQVLKYRQFYQKRDKISWIRLLVHQTSQTTA